MASTQEYTLHPSSGWVQVAAGAIASFLRIHHFPHHIPLLITVGTATPAETSGGLRSDCGETWFNGAIAAGTNVYARISNNSNGSVRVSVFQN